MSWVRNIKVGQKLIVLIVLAAVLLASIGAVGYAYMRDMAKDTEIMYKELLEPINTLNKLKENNRKMDSYMLEAILSTNQQYSLDLIASIKELINENIALETPELFIDDVVSLETYGPAVGDFSKKRQASFDLIEQQRKSEAYVKYVGEVKPQGQTVDAMVDQLAHYYADKAELVNRLNDAKVTSASLIIIIVIAAGIVILMLVGITITRMITKPLTEMQDWMALAEQGDFSQRHAYQSKDELGHLFHSFQHMIDSLTATLRSVKNTAGIVAASSAQLSESSLHSKKASSEITDAIQQVAAGSENQLHGIENSSLAVDRITEYADHILTNTVEVKESARQSSFISTDGKRSVEEMILQMNAINDNVNGLSTSVIRLSERSDQIGSINDAITAIADQTNLLALNAAIEAARAGEHGKGFAVVADEVRHLAEQSVRSAEQIAALIQQIQTETNETLQSMEVTTAGVKEGIRVVEQTGESFEKIGLSVAGVSEQIDEVSNAIEQLTQQAVQASKAIRSVKDIAVESAAMSQNASAGTEEQLASIEEIDTSAASLAAVSVDLENAVSNFKL
ncbi:methyl-accepting chemotaxis protein [Sporosarcina luteola]|nr:methyl-accepting chemotaxis protein [Sporosarcina luteola]